MEVLSGAESAEGEAGHPRTMYAFLCARAWRVASEKRRVGMSERGGVVSTTSSEAGLVGEFLRPFLSYNKDAFCRATLVLAFFFLLLLLSRFFFSLIFFPSRSSAIFFSYSCLSLAFSSPFLFSFNKCLFLSCAIFFLFFSLSLLRLFYMRFSRALSRSFFRPDLTRVSFSLSANFARFLSRILSPSLPPTLPPRRCSSSVSFFSL